MELAPHTARWDRTDEVPLDAIGDGTAEVMKIVVARELMGRESLPY